MPLNLYTGAPPTITLAGPANGSSSTNTTYVLPEFPANGTLECTSSGNVGTLSWQTGAVQIPPPQNSSQLVTDGSGNVAWQPRGQSIPNVTDITFSSTLTNNGGLTLTSTTTGASSFVVAHSSGNNVVTVRLTGSVAVPSDSSQNGGPFEAVFTLVENSSQQAFYQRWTVTQPSCWLSTPMLSSAVPVTTSITPVSSGSMDCTVTVTLNLKGSQSAVAFSVGRVISSASGVVTG